ncbi:MAG: hypothetical protein IT379_20555 [Deltaproteobacteria bacterium]|nr:hypothetical protein [Deltaproteobacteria bacterium]
MTRLDGSILRPSSDAAAPRLPPTSDAASAPRADAGPFTCTSAGAYQPVEGVQCSTDTVTCLNGCTEYECQEACLSADLPCYSCVYTNLYACSQSMGCQAEWDAYVCCAELNGCLAEGADPTCVTTECASQETLANDCFSATYEACAPAYATCFP